MAYTIPSFSSLVRQGAILNWQDNPILAAWVINHSTGFDSSYPLEELNMIKKGQHIRMSRDRTFDCVQSRKAADLKTFYGSTN